MKSWSYQSQSLFADGEWSKLGLVGNLKIVRGLVQTLKLLCHYDVRGRGVEPLWLSLAFTL